MTKKYKFLYLGETYYADTTRWMNILLEFDSFEIITGELTRTCVTMLRCVLNVLQASDSLKICLIGKLDIAKYRDEFIKYGKHNNWIFQLMFGSICFQTYVFRINSKK